MGDAAKKAQGRRRMLPEDPDAKQRCGSIARGSVTTAKIRLRRLGAYCKDRHHAEGLCTGGSRRCKKRGGPADGLCVVS